MFWSSARKRFRCFLFISFCFEWHLEITPGFYTVIAWTLHATHLSFSLILLSLRSWYAEAGLPLHRKLAFSSTLGNSHPLSILRRQPKALVCDTRWKTRDWYPHDINSSYCHSQSPVSRWGLGLGKLAKFWKHWFPSQKNSMDNF